MNTGAKGKALIKSNNARFECSDVNFAILLHVLFVLFK